MADLEPSMDAITFLGGYISGILAFYRQFQTLKWMGLQGSLELWNSEFEHTLMKAYYVIGYGYEALR